MQRKKNTIPLVLLIVRTVFPMLERIAPFLADGIFRMVFYFPLKYPLPDKEIETEKMGQAFSLSVNGKTIRGHRWGDPTKPYILLVHGWAGRATQFRKFIPALVDRGFHVIGPDGPAHGRSDGIKTSIPEFEQMFWVIFEKFGEPAGIITHSFGGAAMMNAALHGLSIKKLVNIASPTIGDEILLTFLRAINGSWRSAERFKRYVIRRTGKSFDDFTALYAVQRLPKPIDLLMINDAEDKDVVFRSAEELLKVYPSAKLYKTSGLGHTRILRDDQVITKALEFIVG